MKDGNPIIPGNEPDRLRAKTETTRSFIVEASAGTGKTRTLVDRILRLALEAGPKGPPLRLHEICAITFTEKAAGEMKLRLRQHFQEILTESEADDDRLERARTALYDLESASISTFHSFAVSLLKERPVEAGLDPRFSALNEIQSELFFRKAWEAWIGRALAERHPTLEKALRSGFRLNTLETLARTMRSKWLTIRDLECDPPPTGAELQSRAEGLRRQGLDFRQRLLNPADKLAGYLDAALEWVENPHREGTAVRKPGGSGAAANWDGGKETVAAAREYVRAVVEFRDEMQNLPAQKLLYEVIDWIRKDFMIAEWETRKREGGLLDFDDQLRLAYELLLENPSVRRECLDQYKTLLVDEFQDTDSIQWRIVLLLTSPDTEQTDFSRMRPEPGRLFIVGDPKQSIYRFRNADIETYLDIVEEPRRKALDLELLRLTTNFRSVPSILQFVDAVFERAMGDAGERRYQQRYLAFGGDGYRKENSPGPAVRFLADSCDEEGSGRSTREFLQLESSRIAELIRSIRGSEKWGIGEGGTLRAPEYGDMAILLPVLTRADILEEALRERDIPYVLEGGKFYYARSEVSSAITVLKAVANPNDRVALYGALRSIFFGFSDEELLHAHVDGRPLDYRAPTGGGSILEQPFEILRDLHRFRHRRSASETYEILLERTGAREILAARGFQSLANLGKLGRTLRSLQGDATFSQVVDLMGMMDEERMAESESRLMEEHSDAVRVMSIHKAKGLDFPIVLVAALGLQRRGRTENLLADPNRRKIFALSIGSKEGRIQSKSWSALAEDEKQKDDAELTRLLYVALTRARDHMVVSIHTAGWKQLEDTEQWVPDTEKTRLKPLGAFLEDCCRGQVPSVGRIDAAQQGTLTKAAEKGPQAATPDLQKTIEREYRELRAFRDAAASQAPPEAEEGQEKAHDAETAGSRSIRLGLAFHEAMERADLTGAKVPALSVSDIATRYKLDPAGRQTLAEMLETSLSSDLLQRACGALRAGKRFFREFPFVRMRADASVEEGKIDLLFEEEDGWTLVDYKTDRVDGEPAELAAAFREKYAAQIRGYIDALKDVSVEVSSAHILLGRTGQSIRIL